ncbi:hypothetical protein J6590_054867 [Homalodisca vitripennis]|nr:hypothetical protein J6590_054867 [Homalodisca vitripennis]
MKNTASTQKKVVGSLKTARTPNSMERVRVAVTCSPKRSARKPALALGLQKIPAEDFAPQPDCGRRVVFCDELLTFKN